MPITGRVPARSTALGAVAVSLLVACGAPQAKVDPSPIVQPLTKRLNDLGVTVANIDCPTDVDRSPGSSFGCTVKTDKGESIKVTVTQRDEGGQLRLAWDLGSDVVTTDKFLGDLTAYARQVSGDLTVACPKVAVVPGGTGKLVCDVTDSKGQSAKLTVPLKNGAPDPDRSLWSLAQI